MTLLIMPVVMTIGCAGEPAPTSQSPATEVAVPTEEAPLPATEAAELPQKLEDVTLTVFAAASLADAFTQMGKQFDAANPGVTTEFNFAGSNQLATQINEGAPADVFASANIAQMDAVVESGRVAADAPVLFVTNRLVVVIPADNPGEIQSLQDLAEPGKLILLAAEEVPVGRYSLEFLDKASADPAFGDSFRDDVLANVASYEENVRSVLNKVALGEADAGIVYTSDLFGVAGVESLEIPDALNVLAEYPIAALSGSENPGVAAAFVEYVLSTPGQAVMMYFGFSPSVR
ncbi:MAG: molybdate ABC transporter substrate-binding protein [Candidatus Promineofilum sp.]|nr:molybdate ABC transporter substrate-binding protein [Promineifilum sp.]MBP9656206.1 molybdate ABC transporter substrate-binding protein [Promineifilum sp.]